MGAAGIADTLVATARERLSTGVRDYTPEEIAAFPVPPPPPRDTADPVPAPPRRPIVPALVVRNRPRRRSPSGVSRRSPCSASWSASSRSPSVSCGRRRRGGAIAVSVVTPTKPTVIATIPPIIKESTQQGVAKLGTGTNPLDQVTILNSSTNAGLALVGPNVQFDYDSAVITAASLRDIQGLSDAIISRNLSGTIYIHGYTDDLGSKEHGLVLSAQRAEAVAKVLQDQLRGYSRPAGHRRLRRGGPHRGQLEPGAAGPQPARDGALQAPGRPTEVPRRLPAASSPLVEVRALHAERGVLPWPGYTLSSSYTSNTRSVTSRYSESKLCPGFLVFPTPPGNSESPVNRCVNPPGRPGRGAPGPPTRGMPTQRHHVEGHLPEPNRVAVREPVVHRHRQGVGVLLAGGGPRSGRRDDLLERAHVVRVLVRRHDDVEAPAPLLDQREQRAGSSAASTRSCAPDARQVSR